MRFDASEMGNVLGTSSAQGVVQWMRTKCVVFGDNIGEWGAIGASRCALLRSLCVCLLFFTGSSSCSYISRRNEMRWKVAMYRG